MSDRAKSALSLVFLLIVALASALGPEAGVNLGSGLLDQDARLSGASRLADLSRD